MLHTQCHYAWFGESTNYNSFIIQLYGFFQCFKHTAVKTYTIQKKIILKIKLRTHVALDTLLIISNLFCDKARELNTTAPSGLQMISTEI